MEQRYRLPQVPNKTQVVNYDQTRYVTPPWVTQQRIAQPLPQAPRQAPQAPLGTPQAHPGWHNPQGHYQESYGMGVAVVLTGFHNIVGSGSSFYLMYQAYNNMSGKLFGSNVFNGVKEPFYRQPLSNRAKVLFGVGHAIIFSFMVAALVVVPVLWFIVIPFFGYFHFLLWGVDYLARRTNRREAMFVWGISTLIWGGVLASITSMMTGFLDTPETRENQQ